MDMWLIRGGGFLITKRLETCREQITAFGMGIYLADCTRLAESKSVTQALSVRKNRPVMKKYTGPNKKHVHVKRF